MPKHLLLSCLLYIAARGTMAVLAPLHERGVPQFASPVLMLLLVSVAVLFMRRVKWAWKFMQWIALTEIAVNAFFFPTQAFHGAYTGLVQLLITAIMVACSVILWSLFRSPEAKAWFART